MPWIQRWMTAHAVILLISCFLFLGFKNINCISYGATISFVVLFIWKARESANLLFLISPANFITLLRLNFLFLLLHTHDRLSGEILAVIALIIVLLDGLDGFLARKFNSISDFGAYFDMETDAFYVYAIICIHYTQGKVGLWLMFIAILRYLYFLLLLLFKPQKQKESRDYFAQIIAVILMLSLIIPFISPSAIYLPVLIISSFLVLWSFGKSFAQVLTGRFQV